MNLFDNIKIKYNKLTSSEMKIADFIIKNHKKVLEMSAKEIGDETKTSAATVVRFCKKIEIDGLDTLKVKIAQSSFENKESTEIDPILSKDDSMVDIINKIYTNVEVGLKRAVSLLVVETLEKVVELIKRSNGIYIYAIGSSGLCAYDLYHKLNRVNKKTYYNQDPTMSIEFSGYTKPDDVVIAISYSGNSKEVLLAVEESKKQNTPIVAIVKEGKTRLGELADYCLYIPNKERKVRIGSLESKFSQMLIADILYYAVAKENMDSFIEFLKDISDKIGKFKG